jgi:hypothetical protein
VTKIDPRGPRFGAAITSILALTSFALGYSGERQLAALLTALLALLFAWNVLSPATHPYALFFKGVIRPRLGAPKELEDPRPPRFAQQVGLGFALLGLAGFALDMQLVQVVASAFIFLAAWLNSVFDFCLGCQVYLLLKRTGLFGKGDRPASA